MLPFGVHGHKGVLMKNKILFAALAMAKDSGSGDSNERTKFEGKWTNTGAISNAGFTEFSVTFTGSDVVFKSAHPSKEGATYTATGTFTFTNTHITFDREVPWTVRTYTQGYTLSGASLMLENA
jgi:hypothetical protein